MKLFISVLCFGALGAGLITPSLQAAAPAKTVAKEFNVKNYGAIGDGVTLDSPAINRAIEAAAGQGGGVVVLPPGKYLSGSIRMKSHINLRIDKGATLLADNWDSKSYDPTEPYLHGPYQDGGHSFFQNSLIWGENLTHVSITGGGLIDGSALTAFKGDLNKKIGFGKGSEGDAPAAPEGLHKPTYAANKAISLKLCKNVTISGISILKGGWFAILITGCDDVVLDSLIIDTNRDGIDIDCCHNVVVKNCQVNSPDDDGICPKSTYALGYARTTENLLITDCVVSGFEVGTLLDGTRKENKAIRTAHGRIKFGTESSGGFRNCVVKNCTFISSMGFALEEVDGGILENITVDNLKMTDVKNYVLYIVTGERNRTPNLKTVSRMKNIKITNVVAEGVGTMSGIQIFGLPNQPIENVHLENIRIVSKGGGTAVDAARQPKELGTGYPDPAGRGNMPAYGLFARNVKGLTLKSINFSFEQPDVRPVAELVRIDGLVLDTFSGQVADGVPVVKFGRDVRGVQVLNSPTIIQPK